jgi:single-stranded-DNA-specific exonuclease
MDKFEQYVNSTITEEQLVPSISIDTELTFSEINEEFFRIINQFQPFGPENMSPLFISKNVFDTGTGRMVGAQRRTP